MNTASATSVRTTVMIKPRLLQELKTFSARKKLTMSEVISRGVSLIIEQEKSQKLKKMYSVLQEPVKAYETASDASKKIDDVLYNSLELVE